MKKYVNGECIDMTEEEIAEIWHWKKANIMCRIIQFICAIEILLIRFIMISLIWSASMQIQCKFKMERKKYYKHENHRIIAY